jgi:hypothetical protein
MFGWLGRISCFLDLKHDLVERHEILDRTSSTMMQAAVWGCRTSPVDEKSIKVFYVACARCGQKIAPFEVAQRGWTVRAEG